MNKLMNSINLLSYRELSDEDNLPLQSFPIRSERQDIFAIRHPYDYIRGDITASNVPTTHVDRTTLTRPLTLTEPLTLTRPLTLTGPPRQNRDTAAATQFNQRRTDFPSELSRSPVAPATEGCGGSPFRLNWLSIPTCMYCCALVELCDHGGRSCRRSPSFLHNR